MNSTIQEWLRCHGITESAALAWTQAQQLECFLEFVQGRTLPAMKPWMTAAMLVPGHDFGWESPDTVETLLPEWYRDPATGYVEILPSISGDKRYQEKWINAINALPSEMVLIFRNIPQCFFDPL